MDEERTAQNGSENGGCAVATVSGEAPQDPGEAAAAAGPEPVAAAAEGGGALAEGGEEPGKHRSPEEEEREREALRAEEELDAVAEPAPEVPAAELLSRLEEAREESERLKERLLRTTADLENFRRRAQREVDEARKYGTEALLRDILPVADNLERALQHLPEEEARSAIAEGVRAVHSLLLDTLRKHGVESFSAVGKPFDPTLHEAVSQVETSEVPSGHVFQEWQKGYLLNGRLVRPSLVIVARAPAGTEPPPTPHSGDGGDGGGAPLPARGEDSAGDLPN